MAILSRTSRLLAPLFVFLALAGTASAAVNLTSYQPPGWVAPLVISTTTGTNTHASSFSNTQNIYVDWAVINDGTTATATTFYVSLILDGTTIASWYTNPPLYSNYYVSNVDYVISPLAAGTHTLTVRADSTGALAESNESDNQYSLNFTVSGSGVNLTPYQPSGWSAPIVVSSVSGTTADSSGLTNASTLYIDWAVANLGAGATGARFYTELLVDGVVRTSWYSDPPINSGTYVWVTDYSIGTLSAGTHTITIRTDAFGAISETNEADNQYSRTISIGSAAQVNLTPYTPSGWPAPIVYSKVAGTRTDGSGFTTADAIYVDWAVINSGSGATTARFFTELLVDGVVRNSWYSDPPVNAGYYVSLDDYSIGTLSAGTHTITLRADSTGTISESNESDNQYSRTITVSSATAPNLTAFTPTGWSAPIVVSKVTGTNSDGTLSPTDTLYVDWAAQNNGSGATAARFYTELLVDGLVRTSWYSDPPVSAGSYVNVVDYSIGTLAAGSHTIAIRIDSTSAVAETNESDNVYTRTINVVQGNGLYSGPASATSAAGVLTSTTSFAPSKSALFAPHGVAEPDRPFELLPDPEGFDLEAASDRSHEIDDEPSDRSPWASRVEAAVTASTFAAFSDTGWIPPDPHMAVGPNHVVAAVNSAFAIFSKTGTLQKQIDSHPWFQNVVAGLGTSLNSFDPRVLYDHSSNRWIIAFIATNEGDTPGTQSWIMLSVSDDSDPNGNWCNYGIRGDRNGTTAVSNWSDYDMLGYDSQAIYISTNQFTYGAGFAYSKIRLIPKTQLYSSQCAAFTWTDFWDLRQPSQTSAPAFTVHPVVTYGTAAGEHFVSDSPFSTGTWVTLWTLKNPLSSPTLEAVDVPVTAGLSPPNANQLGGSAAVPGCPEPCLINTGDRRVLSAFYRNGSVWATQTVAGGTNNAFARARYLRIGTSPVSKLEEQSFGLDNCWYFEPAAATDASQNLLMTFARSCLSDYAGLGYTTRAATDSALQASVMVRSGGANYVKTFGGSRNRWGDYFAVAVDPSDSAKLWLHGQYAANTANTWATHIASVSFTTGCSMTINPASVAAGTAGTAYPTVTFSATGAPGSVTFSRTGTIPTGMTFSGATLSGTPTSVGSHAFTINAASGACAASRSYTLSIGCPSIAVNPSTIPQGSVGAAYGVTFSAAGAIGGVTFSRTGTLPSGMTFSGATLSGTPTQSGSFNITITAQDANGCTGSRAFTLVIQSPAAAPQMVHRAGDFNGDGRADLLWRVLNTGQDMMWLMNGPNITTQYPLETVSTLWQVVGVADFTGDGRADILWRLPSTGQNSLWTMNGTQRTAATYIEGTATNLRVAGVGDFNADGRADILWRNDSNGVNMVWLMNGATKLAAADIAAASPNWSLAGVGDFNGDGRADLLWRDPSTGNNAIWLMNGTALLSSAYIDGVAPAWHVGAVADFNGDARADIFWRVQSSGTNALWTMNGTARLSAVYAPAAAPNFTLVSFGDFNADGRADLWWRDPSSGSNSLWQMNGATLAAGYGLGTLAPAWRVVP